MNEYCDCCVLLEAVINHIRNPKAQEIHLLLLNKNKNYGQINTKIYIALVIICHAYGPFKKKCHVYGVTQKSHLFVSISINYNTF